MVTKDEALKLALEALEEIADEVFSPYDNKLGGAILAIREALAQPEQEPVAYTGNGTAGREADVRPTGFFFQMPPHRKPLTDEEIDKLPWEPHESNPMTFAEGLRYFARAIEAAHGIKE